MHGVSGDERNAEIATLQKAFMGEVGKPAREAYKARLMELIAASDDAQDAERRVSI